MFRFWTGPANPWSCSSICVESASAQKMTQPHLHDVLVAGHSAALVFRCRVGATTRWLHCRRMAGAPAHEPLPPPPIPGQRNRMPTGDLDSEMQPGAQWVLPAAAGEGTRRVLDFFKGELVTVSGQTIGQHAAIDARANEDVRSRRRCCSRIPYPQGRPDRASRVAQEGPFVMNTREQLRQAYSTMQHAVRWLPWPEPGAVHGIERRRLPGMRRGARKRTRFRTSEGGQRGMQSMPRTRCCRHHSSRRDPRIVAPELLNNVLASAMVAVDASSKSRPIAGNRIRRRTSFRGMTGAQREHVRSCRAHVIYFTYGMHGARTGVR